jgi:hypothetical protein
MGAGCTRPDIHSVPRITTTGMATLSRESLCGAIFDFSFLIFDWQFNPKSNSKIKNKPLSAALLLDFRSASWQNAPSIEELVPRRFGLSR